MHEPYSAFPIELAWRTCGLDASHAEAERRASALQSRHNERDAFEVFFGPKSHLQNVTMPLFKVGPAHVRRQIHPLM